MKHFSWNSLVGFLLLAGSTTFAQTPVFTDIFSNGSTTNGVSVPGGTPTASLTSYDMASTKTVTNSSPAGHLKIGLSGATTGGFWELQAVFASSPVTLTTVGDYITLSYTFTNSIGGLLAGGTSSYILNGLFNSGGSTPVAGSLAIAGLTSVPGSTYGSGHCANWQGYVSRISAGGTSQAYTRPAQTNFVVGPSADQDLVGNGFGGGAYTNLTGQTFDTFETNSSLALVSGSVYTVSYSIALTAAGTITVTNNLFSGVGTAGALLFSQTNTATTTNVLTTSFDGLAIGARNSGTSFDPVMDIGQIAVSASIFGSPGPSFDVTGGGAGCPGDAFLVGLSGSVITNVYRLYTNGVFDGQIVPGNNGSAISFGPQNVLATYTVQASNTVSGNTGMMNGSAVISLVPAPSVTSQPVAATVANNSAAYFNVAVSGSTLTFQWYKNGVALTNGAEFSGATSSNLLINPVSSADAAGYYCIISNACGLKTVSTTNNLTLGSAASLVWQGGNPNNNWDVAATANFNSSPAVVFHNGDNVTFDDTSANTTVSLVGSYLSPGTITENSSQGYSFGGTGSLFGSSSLNMIGSGTLTVSNANAFTGGTTINNGVVLIRTYNNPLGTGPVTINSGNLEVPMSGASGVGLTNNIVAGTGGGKLQYDQSGTYACVLNGALSGNSGSTLNIYNYDAATSISRVRLYGVFVDNANISLTSLGSEVEMAPYMGAGDQVYNGVISGTYGRITPRGNGNVIFNGQNTFNDSSALNTGYTLFMSSGNVGFGADSISSVPPTIDSGPASTGNIGINVGVEGGNCSFFASGGAHTVANPIIYTSATNTVTVTIGGVNDLTLSGAITLSGADGSGGTNRILQVTNTGLTTLSGVVGDNGTACGIVKTGPGTLALTAAETYTGGTTVGAGTLWVNGQLGAGGVTVTNGTLGGTGTISSPVTVTSAGAISAGTSTIGTLTINGNLTLAGNGLFKVNKSLAQSNDLVSVSGTLAGSGSGTVTVTNLGPALVVGDKFTLFSQPVAGGATLSVTGGGMNWTNRLAIDGSIQALSVASTTANYPTNVTFAVSGNSLTIGWPATHLGWILQAQTNTLGAGLTTPTNTWIDVAGTASGTNASITINHSNPTVFFRLRHP